MGKLDVSHTRDLLQQFKFDSVFIEELGWSQSTSRKPVSFEISGATFERKQIAQLSGVVVFEITTEEGNIPDAKTRAAVHKEIAKLHFENLLIFINHDRAQSLWYWVKREEGKSHPREHWYFRGQPGDLFLSKLSAMVFDLQDFDEEGNAAVVEVANRLKQALDVEKVTKRFYAEFHQEHLDFLELISGIDDERDRRWYASIMLNRLMFIYFLQRKHFLDEGDTLYLQNKLNESKQRGKDSYYESFLKVLFFKGFAVPEEERGDETNALLGKIKYLNGGLFIPHPIEDERWKHIEIPDKAFENLFALFERYSWNLNDTPGGDDNELNPDVLGYIFEKYINQKAFGAYYTRPEITDYLCERTIHQLILDRINALHSPLQLKPEQAKLFGAEQQALFTGRKFDSMAELLMNLNAPLCRLLLNVILPELSLLDPACGSGAFLVAAMKTLINVYSAIIGKIKFLNDTNLTKWLRDAERDHKNLSYFIKKRIITDNLFGVDVMEEATEIAKLRLFLALVASAQTVDQLEPLPNIDFNIMAGNSLIGLMQVDGKAFDNRFGQGHLFTGSHYEQVLQEKNRLIDLYRHTATWHDDLRALRNKINDTKKEAMKTLNEILLEDFNRLGIKFEEATWDDAKKKDGKPKKRALEIADIETLQPFHWGYEFDEIINKRGGFDAIITNPPWEIFKPQAKEFFAEHSELVTKNKMLIKEFEKEQSKLLKDEEIRDAWLVYQSRFPHVSLYYRNAPQYKNQIAVVNGKKAGSDINYYKLFLEECFNLLRDGGRCGIIVPSGIYTDLGAKQLRELLFSKCELDSLICLSNERFIFEGVHHSFKFCLLSFEKGGPTSSFEAAFRINPREAIGPDQLNVFLHNKEARVVISLPLIRRLSPESISVMEFRSDADIHIAEKMQRFPLLGERLENKWNLVLCNEFHMTNDSHLFKTKRIAGCLPLYEGKMIHQFNHLISGPRYWIEEKEGRKALLKREPESGQILDYQDYRIGFRRIGRTSDQRTLIATILPKNYFASESFNLSSGRALLRCELPALVSLLNSFVLDYCLRQRVSANINLFYAYQLPVPRLTAEDAEFAPIVDRSARLICTTAEYDDLWQSIKSELQAHGYKLNDALRLSRDPNGNFTRPEMEHTVAELRAELDAMVAHLYQLTEEEFAHILATFPLAADSAKEAALQAYRELAPHPDEKQLQALIAAGERNHIEFKVAACWNAHKKAKDDKMKDNIVQSVAAFMNSRDGGALLIGVGDAGDIVGLAEDFQAADSKKSNRDGYELFLRNVLSSELGGNHDYAISFHTVAGKEICRIAVEPSSKPVYVRGEIYIRAGNQKRKLSAKEAIDYAATRW